MDIFYFLISLNSYLIRHGMIDKFSLDSICLVGWQNRQNILSTRQTQTFYSDPISKYNNLTRENNGHFKFYIVKSLMQILILYTD